MNLADVLMEHPMPDGEGLLLTHDREVSAAEAKAMARSTAADIISAGITPGQAVGIRMPNIPETVTTMFGIWLAGAVCVPINERSPEPEQDKMLQGTGAAAVIDSAGLHRLDGDHVYDPGTALILWTSGTTGPPKPIIHTHPDYLGVIDRVLNALRGDRPRNMHPSPNLIPTSLALNSGIYNALFGLRSGAALVIMDRFEPHEFADLVRRYGIKSTVLPPAAMVALTDSPDVTDLAPLEFVRSITAPLSPLQGKRFVQKFGVYLLNGYGQAEIGEVIGWTARDAREHPEKIGSIGRPHGTVDIKFVDDDGAAVAAGEVGRLMVKPREMAAGYAGGTELSDRMDDDGFLDTGDLARIDQDGFVWIEGRGSDLINRGGNKVFPDQVEEVLRLSPQVADVAVVAAPDDRLGEVPIALVVLSAGTESLDTKALDELCREHLLPYKVPFRYVVVPALIRNEVGKLMRRDLAAKYLT